MSSVPVYNQVPEEPCVVVLTPTYWLEWYRSDDGTMMNRVVSRKDQVALLDFCPLCGDEYSEPCEINQ